MISAFLFITGFVLLISLFVIKSLRKRNPHSTKIPGLPLSDPVLGNLPDIAQAGSLLNFLHQLHENYGPVASFWYKDVFTVSLADQKLFKHTERMFDRHPSMFEFALPLISPLSLQYKNGDKGREMYRTFSQAFNFANCTRLLDCVKSITAVTVNNWGEGEPLALYKEMMELAVLTISSTQFGGYFKEEEHVIRFREVYQLVFQDMDDALVGNWDFGKGDEREKRFEKNLAEYKKTVCDVVNYHRDRKNTGEYDIAPFLDIVLDNLDNEEEIIHHAITFMIGGFHTTGLYVSWVLYYAALYPEVQERMRKEIRENLGSEGMTSMKDAEKLQYIAQVMEETLRVSKIAFFSVRQAEKDIEIDGLLIKKDTQVVNALSVTMDDETLFPEPHKFDPDRFSPERKVRGLANSPFGFGVRKCPGYRFSNMEVMVMTVEVLSKYQIDLAFPEEDMIKPVYGFVTKPEREILVKLKSLQN